MQLLQFENKEELTFDIAVFDTVLQMQSYYFQKTCKDLMNTGGTYVELQTSNESVIFKSDDSLLACELSLYETAEGFRFKKKPQNSKDDIVSYGVFTLRHLVTFTKCPHGWMQGYIHRCLSDQYFYPACNITTIWKLAT